MYAIEAVGLNKTYTVTNGPIFRKKKTEIHAVRDVSFTIEPGTIFGLLGPNGAGKTTIIKILSTLLLPNAGSARVFGKDVDKDEKAVRKMITAVLPGERSLFWKLTVFENLRYFGALYGIYGKACCVRIDELLKEFQLEDKRNELVERLSTGLRQRVVLCRALLPAPKVLLLDEPTLGLDPVSGKALREYIQKIKRNGTTILLTTHYMLEADYLADQVAIIKEGRFIANDTPSYLKKQFQGSCIVSATIKNGPEPFFIDVAKAGSIEYRTPAAEPDSIFIKIRSTNRTSIITDLITLAQTHGCEIHNIDIQEPTLEDAYISLTGSTIAH